MSQNYVYDKSLDKLLLAGWDKEKREVFLALGTMNKEGDGWNDPIDIALTAKVGQGEKEHSIDEAIQLISGFSSAHKVPLPHSLKEAITGQIKRNAENNERIDHSNKDAPVELSENPLATGYFRG